MWPSEGFPGGTSGKEPTSQRRQKRHRFRFPTQEGPLEEGAATHSSFLAWRIPWTEEPGRLQSMWSQRVRHNWSGLAHTHTVPGVKSFIFTPGGGDLLAFSHHTRCYRQYGSFHSSHVEPSMWLYSGMHLLTRWSKLKEKWDSYKKRKRHQDGTFAEKKQCENMSAVKDSGLGRNPPCQHLELRLPAPRKKFLLLKAPSLCDFIMAMLAKQYTG